MIKCEFWFRPSILQKFPGYHYFQITLFFFNFKFIWFSCNYCYFEKDQGHEFWTVQNPALHNVEYPIFYMFKFEKNAKSDYCEPEAAFVNFFSENIMIYRNKWCFRHDQKRADGNFNETDTVSNWLNYICFWVYFQHFRLIIKLSFSIHRLFVRKIQEPDVWIFLKKFGRAGTIFVTFCLRTLLEEWPKPSHFSKVSFIVK